MKYLLLISLFFVGCSTKQDCSIQESIIDDVTQELKKA